MPSSRIPVLLVVVLSVTTLLPTTAHAGGPTFPVYFPQDPHVTTFSNDYGAPRHGARRHIGIDLMAPKMTPVYAFADGEVLKVASSIRAGRYLIIGHADGWETYYIHLNNDSPGTDDGMADWTLTVAPGVSTGAAIKGGQLIGWVGDSGNAESTMPHTHFELHHRGRPVNPHPILAAARDRALGVPIGVPLDTVGLVYID